MPDTAVVALAAVLVGGPAVMLTPFWLARRSSESHANTTAAAIRARQRQERAERPKELTR
ncbi:hypothetical protein CSH63_29260 [Micromonospora tulbaghiae]|uniref:Uncharacterized protein n=1 Tax=Micromonospora tulbaghiae TaxID=479978 RepID=A0A386WU02_9ACTN|nr:hypothetical protein [Micromonospora tulbaghiae]AYF31463.1 hypothetical protein CSH63_29260 [Micromonospora tulbaghiae]